MLIMLATRRNARRGVFIIADMQTPILPDERVSAEWACGLRGDRALVLASAP